MHISSALRFQIRPSESLWFASTENVNVRVFENIINNNLQAITVFDDDRV